MTPLAWQDAFRHFGKDIPYEVIPGQIGKGGDLLVPDVLNAREMRTFGEKLKKFRKELFRRNYLPEIRPFPRIREHFQILRERNTKIVLGSSSDESEVRHYVKLLDVADLIEGSTSKDDAEFSKPSPEIFEAALRKAGSPRSRTIVVGDTPYDVLAAHRLALPIVALCSGGFDDSLLRKAEFLFEDTQELIGRLDQIDDYFSEV